MASKYVVDTAVVNLGKIINLLLIWLDRVSDKKLSSYSYSPLTGVLLDSCLCNQNVSHRTFCARQAG